MDVPAKFLNLSGTYRQSFKFIRDLLAKFSKFNRDLFSSILNLLETCHQSFKIYKKTNCKVFKLYDTNLQSC